MYNHTYFLENHMDKNKLNSILDVVKQIVNGEQFCESCDAEILEYAEHVTNTLDLFESVFELELTEEQEQILVEVAFDHYVNGEPSFIDLNEDIEVLMDNYSPEEIFCSLLEISNNPTSNPNPASAAQSAQQQGARIAQQAQAQAEADDDLEGENLDSMSPEEREEFLRKREAQAQSDTGSMYSTASQMISNTQAQVEADPNEKYFKGYVSEQVQSLKKHKKKVFRISFIDKNGVKKKGTAVSHKGVMRIVHDKKTFKVYDQNNRDVTAQFKQGKKTKK